MPDTEVAIVGAGIAGLYCALQLKRKFPNKKIRLFELSERVGGRIETWSVKVKPGESDVVDTRAADNKMFPEEAYEEGVEYLRAEFGPMRIEPEINRYWIICLSILI